MSKIGFVFILLLIFISGFQIIASADEEYEEELPNKGSFYGCSHCHVDELGGDKLNGFGLDFEANNLTYDSVLGGKDSDEDGFTNDEEFTAEPATNPGDPQSYPKKERDDAVLLMVLAVLATVTVGLILVWKK